MKDTISKKLELLSKLKSVDKGDVGEDVIFEILKTVQKKRGGIIFHSYKYPYIPNIPGNVKIDDNGKVYVVPGDNHMDEVDLIYVTDYRIFLIEVKAYRSKDIRFTDLWTYHNKAADSKSVLCQSEKHGRHFYHTFYSYLPNGSSEYIIPLVCLVDKCKFTDKRSSKDLNYLPACLRNELVYYLNELDTPLDFRIDIPDLKKGMLEKGKYKSMIT